ncbi:MAG: serine hydrolase domain-containing protein [Gemmatimonadota bacterium]|nr:serine hydrolase domain-containing protein [Gemmatimonadota bacterium]
MRNILLMALLCFFFLPGLTGPVSGQGLPLAEPEEVGLSSARLNRITAVMQDYVDRQKLAGIVTLVARRGRVALFERFGVMDLESKKPMRFDSIFRIYSMTKPVTSVAVMMLYEEGLLQLDDAVEKYLPEFKDIKVFVNTGSGPELVDLEREITILDLLTHTSALNYDFPEGSDYYKKYQEFRKHKENLTLREMVRQLAGLPISHQPGRRWQYSGWSTDVLGHLVEVLSGLSFDVFLEQRIFKPLGMKDTGFFVPEEKIFRFTTLYGPGEKGGIEPIDKPSTSKYTSGPPALVSGSGGLVSTASDYVRFNQMMLGGGQLYGTRLLSRKTVELMTANHLPEHMIPFGFGAGNLEYVTRGFGFGLGYAVLADVARHGILGSEGLFKWAGAANTDQWVDPREELIGIFLTQFMPNGFYPVDRQFRVLVYQAIND